MTHRIEHLAEGVTLHLGDCREILPAIESGVIVSDVPYGVAYKSGWANKFQDVEIANDKTTAARDDVLAIWGDRPALIFGSWKVPRPESTKLVLTWDKGTVGMGDLSLPWFPCTEEIYVIGSGWAGARTSAVMRHVGRNEHHPTEKPVSLMSELVAKCDPALTVIDPFMGSGSTGVAAVRFGRDFIGAELHEPYFDIACRRIADEVRRPRMFNRAPAAPIQEALL